MGRALPSQCSHGFIYDWGDFGCQCDDEVCGTGDHDLPEQCPNGCNDFLIEHEATDAAATVLDLAAKLRQRDAEIQHLRDAFQTHRALIHSTAPDDEVFDSVEKLNAAFEERP